MLFGHQNDANQPDTTPSVVPGNDVQDTSFQTPVINPLAVDPATGVSLPVETHDQADPQDSLSVLDQPVPSSLDSNQPQASVFDAQSAPLPDPSTPFSTAPAATDTPVDSTPQATTYPSPTFASDDTATPLAPAVDSTATPAAGDLLGIKQQALSQLGPLVSHLDQSPEEKFRTTMMLIQTTDNPALLKDAYEAAQTITDEKARAQALLDVVNEINYFTQQQSTTQQ